MYNNWYVLCFLVDCLLAGPANGVLEHLKFSMIEFM